MFICYRLSYLAMYGAAIVFTSMKEDARTEQNGICRQHNSAETLLNIFVFWMTIKTNLQNFVEINLIFGLKVFRNERNCRKTVFTGVLVRYIFLPSKLQLVTLTKEYGIYLHSYCHSSSYQVYIYPR